jgi:hypothetical protein
MKTNQITDMHLEVEISIPRSRNKNLPEKICIEFSGLYPSRYTQFPQLRECRGDYYYDVKTKEKIKAPPDMVVYCLSDGKILSPSQIVLLSQIFPQADTSGRFKMRIKVITRKEMRMRKLDKLKKVW